MKVYLSLVGGVLAALLVTIGVIWGGVSCRAEKERPSYNRLQLALQDADPQVGLAELNHYLTANPESIPVQMQLAALYDERLGQPLSAVYLYRKILLENPDYQGRKEVEKWLAAARKRSLEQLIVEYPELAANAALQENTVLRNELRSAKLQLAELQGKIKIVNKATADSGESELDDTVSVTATATVKPEAEQKTLEIVSGVAPITDVKPEELAKRVVVPPPPAAVEYVPPVAEYVVQKGDNLAKIAQKYYGESGNYLAIYEFNKDVMRSPDALQVGQKLKMPPADKVLASGVKTVTAPAENRKKLPPIKPLTEAQIRMLRGDKNSTAKPAGSESGKPAATKEKTVRNTNAGVTPYLYD